MKRVAFAGSLGSALIVAPHIHRAGAAVAPQFEFQSNFWVNLHHRLYQTADWADARRLGYHIFEPGITLLRTANGLPASRQRAWNDAVESYRRSYITTRRDLLFDDGLARSNAKLSMTPENETPRDIPEAMAKALEETAGAYRLHLWAADHQVNLAWIARLTPRVREFGNAVQRRLSRLYDTSWPSKPFRIDVARYAYRFGAYTNDEPAFVHTVMESGDPRLQGLAAVEMLYHEASHSVVFPDEGSIGAEILAAARRSNHPEPEQFWHAVIFYSAGAIARDIFRAHGHGYRMYADVNGLFGPRVWPSYRVPLQTHWQAYIDHGGDLRVAIDRCVAGVLRA